MTPDEIRIEPARESVTAFARWAVAQTPKIRTVGPAAFAVPAAAFVQAPEEVLIGALVDGHRYVSPAEDAETGTPPPGADLTGVASADAFADTVTAAAGGDSSGPDFAPLEDAPAEEPTEPVEDGDGYACPVCPRTFTTERGRDTHRRQVHRED
ncbi:hypothetical protein [Streptomyces collinus]